MWSHGERLRYYGVPAAALALLAALFLTHGNQALFLLCNGLGTHAVDALWANWTLLGDALVLLVLTLPLVGRYAQMVWGLMLAALLAGLSVWLLKQAFGLPRPPAVLAPDLIHVIGRALKSRSFPSGHTTAAFAYTGVLSLYLRRSWVTAAALVIAVGVGFSRMAVGVHWPMDVAAGAAVGWLCAVAGRAWALRWNWGATRVGQRATALLLWACAVGLLFFFRPDSPLAALLPKVIAVAAMLAAAPAQLRLWRDAA